METLPKSGRGRTLPMSQQLEAVLTEHKRVNGGQPQVFVSDEGLVLDSNRAKHAFWAGVTTARVKRIRIHDLRNSFASQLVAAGVSLFKVQALLGPQDSKMTQRYAHLSPEAQADAVMVLDPPRIPRHFCGTRALDGCLAMTKPPESLTKKWWRRRESNPRPKHLQESEIRGLPKTHRRVS